ncbi:hypothetical protein MMC31_000890 [Peltigera leucophlebia]|nr:hypothetical protein [Peltigera leucophlebia]
MGDGAEVPERALLVEAKILEDTWVVNNVVVLDDVLVLSDVLVVNDALVLDNVLVLQEAIRVEVDVLSSTIGEGAGLSAAGNVAATPNSRVNAAGTRENITE